MRTVGLDTATHTGMALVTEEQGRGKLIEVNEKGFTRLQSIASEVDRTIQIWSPDLVVIEGYAFAHNVSSFTRLVEVGTVVKQVLHRLKLPWVEVKPATLKKWTTGKGNADKVAMGIAVNERWSFKSPSHDIIDAYALAQMGQLGIAEMKKLPGVEVFTGHVLFKVA